VCVGVGVGVVVVKAVVKAQLEAEERYVILSLQLTRCLTSQQRAGATQSSIPLDEPGIFVPAPYNPSQPVPPRHPQQPQPQLYSSGPINTNTSQYNNNFSPSLDIPSDPNYVPDFTNPAGLEFPPDFDFQPEFDLTLDFNNLRTGSSSSAATYPPPEPLEPWADAPDVDAEYDDLGAEGQEPEEDADCTIADTTVRASQITSFLGSLPRPVAPSAQVAQHHSSTSTHGHFLPPAFMPPPSGPLAAMPPPPPVIGVMQSAAVPAHGGPSQKWP
jgi:hypothetical protein